MKQITCTKCGLVDDYTIVPKANNHMAYCNGCDSWITNLPYEKPKFYFGKYKGKLIADVEDLPYMEWMLSNVKLAVSMRDAIRERINILLEQRV